jgi:hypothetical protein
VFDGLELIAEFGTDEDADEYRRDALQLGLPEGFRRSEYDDLFVAEIHEGIVLGLRLIAGLKRSRQQDRSVERCLDWLRLAQEERYAASRV